jgi:hypothetical protein
MDGRLDPCRLFKKKILKPATNYIAKAASLFTIVLAGWFFNILSFKSVLHCIAYMKLHATLSFILSWIALYLLNITVGYQCRKNATFNFLLTEHKYHINEFNRLINEFMSKSLGEKKFNKINFINHLCGKPIIKQYHFA